MKTIFIILFSIFSIFSSVVYADTQAESGSVAATISSSLTDELRLGKEKVQTI